MGYFIIIVTLVILIYFIVKKVRQFTNNLKFPEVEVFGEIIALDANKKIVTIKTKEGKKDLQVKPALFLQLGLEMRGLFTYQKEELKNFTPYEKKR